MSAWKPAPRNACPRCGGLLSSAAGGHRCILGTDPAGNPDRGVYRSCEACGHEVLQREADGAFIDEPSPPASPSSTLPG